MRIIKLKLFLCFCLVISLAGSASALPIFQTTIEGSTAGSQGSDQETWFSYDNPFNLYVVGNYGSNTTSITDVTLLVSVPDGEIGTISFSTVDEEPILLRDLGTNPTRDADISILTNITGNSGYSTIKISTFLPDNLKLDSHYPLKDDVSDFLIFDLGSFSNDENPLFNYNAGDGSITSSPADGEQKEYTITYTGFSWLHFDVYGYVGKKQGDDIVYTWKNNPGSHDATVTTPEPATMVMFVSGLLGLTGMMRKRLRKFGGKHI